MKIQEFYTLLAAVIILTAIFSFKPILESNPSKIGENLLFAIIIITIAVGAKKMVANLLDSDVDHEIWKIYRYGYKPHNHFKNPKLAGIFAPLFFSIISIGSAIIPTILTYETRVKTRRAAKRFGFYSYTSMTDFHNALIGAASTIALLLFAIIVYFLPTNLESLVKYSIYYVLWNLIPFSKLDGMQILFGSKVLYSVLCIITIIATFFALNTI